MPEMKITRSDVIVVDTVTYNDYEDMVFTDKAGNEYKVGSARVHFFDDIIIPGKAVQLNYATNPHRPGVEYIYNAKPVEGELPPAVTAPKPKPKEIHQEINPQERGMCLKEVGECIRCGQMDKDFPKSATRIKTEYYKMISKGAGINFWEKEL